MLNKKSILSFFAVKWHQLYRLQNYLDIGRVLYLMNYFNNR